MVPPSLSLHVAGVGGGEGFVFALVVCASALAAYQKDVGELQVLAPDSDDDNDNGNNANNNSDDGEDSDDEDDGAGNGEPVVKKIAVKDEE